MNDKKGKIVIVGGGLAGLFAAIRAAEKGENIDLISLVPVKRSHSVCAQGGINAAIDYIKAGDSPWQHFYDTVYGGDFLANQKEVMGMCETAPKLIHIFDRMGVPFNRTPEGNLDFRYFGGAKFKRTAFSGATTGQQLLYALDEQVRRLEAEGKITKYIGWEMMSLIKDENNVCKGITAMNLSSMEIKAFPADAVILATGGLGLIYGRSTNSTINTGSAAGIAYTEGAQYANGEFIQVHPTAIPGDDKNRLMSESARGEGGRVWTYKDGKPWYFLEEMYPAYGNLVPRDIATRAIFDVVMNQKLGVDGEQKVYLDLSHIDSNELDRKLKGILDIYEKFVGDDPRKVPMKIFPSMHYTMGGIWSDSNHMTSIQGLFAAGECDYSFHGANRLGANSLLSAAYSGYIAGPFVSDYISEKGTQAENDKLNREAVRKVEDKIKDVLNSNGNENPFLLHEELGQTMTENVTVVRYNDRLQKTDEKICELLERYKNIRVPDKSGWANQPLQFTLQLKNMLELARVITLGALNRNESRGAHYKPDFPERDDENWLKTTIAEHTDSGPAFSYKEVDTSLVEPVKRVYDVDHK